MATTSAVTDEFDESWKKQMAAFLRALIATKPLKGDVTPCQIDEGLYLGSICTASNKAGLKNVNITHILTVAGRLPTAHPQDFIFKIIDGKSRSVTIVVAYLMKTRGMSLSEALQHVRNKRPQASPNSGFIQQLTDFEKSLQGVN